MSHTLFVMDNQTVWGAGNAANGEMGTAEYTSADIPTLLTNVCNVFLESESHDMQSYAVYPNPTSHRLKIIDAPNSAIDRVTVTDLTGKIIFAQVGNIREIGVSDLSSGLYLLTIEASGKIQKIKFIKE